MKHFLSAFYVFTWAFCFAFIMMGVSMFIGAIFIPKTWPIVLPITTSFSIGTGLINAFLHGRPLEGGEVYNPWKFSYWRS